MSMIVQSDIDRLSPAERDEIRTMLDNADEADEHEAERPIRDTGKPPGGPHGPLAKRNRARSRAQAEAKAREQRNEVTP